MLKLLITSPANSTTYPVPPAVPIVPIIFKITSFADIFYNNCFKNGILPIKIDDKIVIELAEYSNRKEEIEISLEKQEIKYGNKVANFELDPFKKKCLMEGLDDIALSMEKISSIDDYEKKLQSTKPWVLNNG